MQDEWGFSIRNIDDPETKNFLNGILQLESCVPFIGGGFTAGERARGGLVPSGSEWMQLMIDQITAADVLNKPSEVELKSYSFQELSDVYFRDDIVNLGTIKQTMNDVFTNVSILSAAKKEFLDIDWPYLYTLNVDDAIERYIDGIKVLPYAPFNRMPQRRFVYKLHGDVDDAISAMNRDELKVIFGRADYIKSLSKNNYLISDLITDFSEKNIIFIGCSLSDEIDISFALASISPSDRRNSSARIFVTSKAPQDYSTKKKLKSYGITDIIVGDYLSFYMLAANIVNSNRKVLPVLEPFEFKNSSIDFSPKFFLQYVVQDGWKVSDNPYNLSISREVEKDVMKQLVEPLVIVWGSRFSGKTTLLYRVMNEVRTRKRYFLNSSVAGSDKLLNAILAAKDSIIAIDSGVLQNAQLRLLSRKTDALRNNNTTILIAVAKNELNVINDGYAETATQIRLHFNNSEGKRVDKLLSPLGFQRWDVPDKILDNLYTIASSPITNQLLNSKSKLYDLVKDRTQITHNKLHEFEFMILFFLAVRQKMYSKTHRTIAKACGLEYLNDSHIEDFSRRWSPFIELDATDRESRSAENSSRVLVVNSYAWIQLALRHISESLNIEVSAELIVKLFSSVKEIDIDAFKLILFDNLNSIYELTSLSKADRKNAIIKLVYDKLAAILAQNPDYWLQRAKGIYYMSDDPMELKIAIAYCEKGIHENDKKTWTNAKLTKANLLGKLCKVTSFEDDLEIIRAVNAYVEVINNRHENPAYIDELLRKSRYGNGYMKGLCDNAKTKLALLPHKSNIFLIESYIDHPG